MGEVSFRLLRAGEDFEVLIQGGKIYSVKHS